MKLPEFGFLEKCKIVGKTLLVQVCLFITLLLLAWGSQALYAKLDRTEFPTPVQITDADKLDENAKGKALVDAITHQMRYELNSTFGWSINDILFNRFVLDNRAYRQYGVAKRVALVPRHQGADGPVFHDHRQARHQRPRERNAL